MQHTDKLEELRSIRCALTKLKTQLGIRPNIDQPFGFNADDEFDEFERIFERGCSEHPLRKWQFLDFEYGTVDENRRHHGFMIHGFGYTHEGVCLDFVIFNEIGVTVDIRVGDHGPWHLNLLSEMPYIDCCLEQYFPVTLDDIFREYNTVVAGRRWKLTSVATLPDWDTEERDENGMSPEKAIYISGYGLDSLNEMCHFTIHKTRRTFEGQGNCYVIRFHNNTRECISAMEIEGIVNQMLMQVD